MIILCLSDNYFENCYGLEINFLDFIFKYWIHPNFEIGFHKEICSTTLLVKSTNIINSYNKINETYKV